MRLTPAQLDTIRSTLAAADAAGRVYLYGSRADDRRRGGDIDLFLEASRPIDLSTALRLQYRLSRACDIHVDLLIRAPGEPELPIHQIARSGIAL